MKRRGNNMAEYRFQNLDFGMSFAAILDSKIKIQDSAKGAQQ
jgi:hypothetical protein